MANTNFFKFEGLSENFAKLYAELGAGNSCSVFGVQNTMRSAIVSNLKTKVLYLTADLTLAGLAVEQFEMMGRSAVMLPAVQDSFLYKKAQSNELYIKRTKALYDILNKNFDVVVMPVQALMSYLPNVNEFLSHTIKLKAGQNIDVHALEMLLVEAGYKKEELIFEEGQFSRRGEVLDIFPIGEKYPYRIDFFDTQIETIKVFDIVTQKGTKEVKGLKICPFSDLFLTEKELEMLKAQVEKLRKPLVGAASDANDSEISAANDSDISAASAANDSDISENRNENAIFNSMLDEIITRLDLKDRSYSLDPLASYLSDFRCSVFDYLEKAGEYTVVFDECKQIYDHLQSYDKENCERIKSLRDAGVLISGKLPCNFSIKEVLAMLENKTSLAFLKITNANKFFKSKAVFNFKTTPSQRYTHNLKEFAFDVKNYLMQNYRVFVFARDASQATSVKNVLLSHDITLPVNQAKCILDNTSILESGLYSGFVLPEEKVAVFGTYDIFPKKREDSKLKINKNHVFSVPKVGDYVVHHIHGIGLCEGVTKLSGSFGTKDYVVIKYHGGDTLYVPTSQMDLLDRFSGAENPKKLNKIGGQDFATIKNKVRESVKKLAFNLIELYAKRDKIKGFAFAEDNDLQREFENAFPFTETEDQLASIAEIKKDMEADKVMDRLVCGDVGFGKTEVALRAMFKAIMDGKQVAFIAPTTILSEQHYNTARARMQDFGIEIEVLNRFKSKQQTDKILAGLELGKIDLVCGTHRILSKDVHFKNLGLIVLDEEQKFGVEDKEKLKVEYPNVDVLTLSATPIPRTLNMSLSGIRDISIISTPPSERLPIQTYVLEFSEQLVRDAINREMSRDGQVFILFNSVEKIYTFAEKIRRIVPDCKILVAHGQMNAKQMEQVIYDFYHKKGDILICTTIIENGIDIENANTLIVYDADKLGLSQLYQIRGRVGRGSRLAYAYFTYEYNKVLTEEAYKRLDAMSEFCEFGSGFKLAMRDLEIRGGGNILGAEQSGHLQKVGYDMYSRLLAEAVKELKGEKVEEKQDVLIKVAIDAYVPDTYISTSEERMVTYKQIAATDSVEAAEKLKRELYSAYGAVPDVVNSLIEISLARQTAKKIDAVAVVSSGAEVDIVFDNKSQIASSDFLGEAIYKFRMNCSLDMTNQPTIRFYKERLCRENFELAKKFLLTAASIKEKKEQVSFVTLSWRKLRSQTFHLLSTAVLILDRKSNVSFVHV